MSWLDHTRNGHITEIMKLDHTILDIIESETLMWYGHLERMPEIEDKENLAMDTSREEKNGRPPRLWKDKL